MHGCLFCVIPWGKRQYILSSIRSKHEHEVVTGQRSGGFLEQYGDSIVLGNDAAMVR